MINTKVSGHNICDLQPLVQQSETQSYTKQIGTNRTVMSLNKAQMHSVPIKVGVNVANLASQFDKINKEKQHNYQQPRKQQRIAKQHQSAQTSPRASLPLLPTMHPPPVPPVLNGNSNNSSNRPRLTPVSSVPLGGCSYTTMAKIDDEFDNHDQTANSHYNSDPDGTHPDDMNNTYNRNFNRGKRSTVQGTISINGGALRHDQAFERPRSATTSPARKGKSFSYGTKNGKMKKSYPMTSLEATEMKSGSDGTDDETRSAHFYKRFRYSQF